MITILDKHNCCGCEACVQVCPKQCISFTADNEGFSYPKVDEAFCINCGLCERVCPVLHPYKERTPLKTLAAINENDEVRLASSSGGIFTLLAEQVIGDGGAVFGARFDDQWQVVFDFTETIEGIKAFQGSKYLQAQVGNSFANCKKILDDGRKVLFSGTQCQIAGLLHFLRKPYDNLLTVDFICHGVPSPLVWHRYLNEEVTIGSRTISDIQFRNKERGWKLFNFKLEYDDDCKSVVMSTPFNDDLYMRAFLANLILRPSCHACPAKSGKSHSDITIADFWGIELVNPDMDDGMGTSLVLVNSEKGACALPYELMKFSEEVFDVAIKKNSAWGKPAIPHHRRSFFWGKLADSKSIAKLITQALRPTLRQQMSLLKKPQIWVKMFFGNLRGAFYSLTNTKIRRKNNY